MNIGVILSAGDGKRFGGYMNKQYLKLNGKEVVSYALASMRECDNIDKIILVVDKQEFESKYIQNKYNVCCIEGGETRNISIKNALDYIKDNYGDCKKVIIHDSVRPLTQKERFCDYIKKLDSYDAVVTICEINDALVDTKLNNIDRDNYCLVQCPEAYNFAMLYKYFNEQKRDLPIISQLNFVNIKKEKSDIFNTKITYPEDLFMCEQLMRLNFYSVSHNQFEDIGYNGSVLLLGASGGIGQTIKDHFINKGITFLAPSHSQLDLQDISVQKIQQYINGRNVDAIINAAAVYFDDDDGLSATFDKIFNVNVKANLVLIEYALALKKAVNIIFMSSSSSTKGREKLTNYSAAKAGLNSIVESQAKTLAENNIILNAIIPEKVNTPLIQKLHKTAINVRELLQPSDVMNVIMNFLQTKEYGKLVHIRKGL